MPKQKDEEVKQAIHEAAKRVFQKWGVNKTTMEDIAREAGKGKSTLYYYFKSKEEIFEYVVTEEFSYMLDNSKRQIENIKSAREKLRQYIVAMLEEMKKTVSIYPIVSGEIKGKKEFIERIQKKLDLKEEAIIKDILSVGLESGEFSILCKDQLDKTASVILAIVRGFELYLFVDNDDDEIVDIVTKLITTGI